METIGRAQSTAGAGRGASMATARAGVAEHGRAGAQATKGIREGSAAKRAAILAAARELMLADGFERTSVDAIAARAEVSKRTVYDYYGDKRTLLRSVVETTADSLLTAINRAMSDNLRDVDDLRSALVGFALDVTTSAIGSSDYSALIRLVSTEEANLSELHDNWASEPEDTLADRFQEFERLGLLDVPKPRVAADHFVALTLMPTANTIGFPIRQNDATTRQIIDDGVDAFLRAYGPRAG